MSPKPITIYPRPDWSGFLKATIGMALSLAFIHCAPDISVWAYRKFGWELVLNERRMEIILLVANVMFCVGFTVGLSGLLWSIWHYPRRLAYEQDRAQQLAKSVDIEVAERLAEMKVKQ